MMPGKGKEQDQFVALDTQPKYRLDNGDLMIHLQAPDLGSLRQRFIGLFRGSQWRKVPDYAINPNKQGVVIDVLDRAAFYGSGEEVAVSGTFPALMPTSVSVARRWRLESLAALVNGAIAFDSPEKSKPAEAEDTLVCMKIWPTASVA
ncbi:hypothetical protein ACLK15_10790 [Escherichia coli]